MERLKLGTGVGRDASEIVVAAAEMVAGREIHICCMQTCGSIRQLHLK